MAWEDYKRKIIEALDLFEFDEGILSTLENSVKQDQKIFVAGNGGSAALANHYACDFSKGANQNWVENFRRYKAICLASNVSYLTAISNDAHYQEIFKQQLINLASPNDILVLISSSGNSPSIIEAAEYGKSVDLITIGITGFDGGKLKEIADYSAHIKYPSYEICEDIHSIFGHFLAVYLREQSLPGDN